MHIIYSQNKKESVDHLLLHCTKTGILWQIVLSLFRLLCVITLFKGDGSFVRKMRKKAWKADPLSIF